jgi:hypothetical protein
MLLMDERTPIEALDVNGPYEFPNEIKPLQEFRDLALAARPDLKVAQQNLELAKSTYKLTVANGSTDPTWSVWTTHNPSFNNPYDYNTIGASVSFPIRLFDRNQGEKARTKLDITKNEDLVTGAAKRRARENLHEIRSCFPGRPDLGGHQRARKDDDVVLPCEIDDFQLEVRTRQEAGAGIQAAARRFQVHHRPRADDQVRVLARELLNDPAGSRNRHRHFGDRKPGGEDSLHREFGVFSGIETNGGKNPEWPDPIADRLSVHKPCDCGEASSDGGACGMCVLRITTSP